MSERAKPPRVWIVDPINYGGMAYYDVGLADGLAHAGADVTLVGSDTPLVAPEESSDVRFVPIFRGSGPTLPRWRRGINYAMSSLRLVSTLRASRPDWVVWNYFQMPRLDRFTIGAIARLGCRVAFIAHETEPWDPSPSSRRVFGWLVERTSDLVIVHGEENARSLADTWTVPPDRLLISEHGDYRGWIEAGLDQDQARRDLGLDTDAPIALLFGTLRSSKGLSTLVQAWPAVRSTVPDARLVIAGRTQHGTGSVALADLPAGTTHRASLISPDEANRYFAACDLVVIPYDRITTSGVLRHAYSAGRPVVATMVGELPTHVVDGHTGRLVQPGDVEALTHALSALLGDRSAAAAMGVAARSYAQARFDWADIGKKTLEALEANRGPRKLPT